MKDRKPSDIITLSGMTIGFGIMAIYHFAREIAAGPETAQPWRASVAVLAWAVGYLSLLALLRRLRK